MRIKPGVVIYRIGPKVERAFEVVDAVYVEILGFEATLTGCREGNHRLHSWHYFRADDPRRWPLNPDGSQGAGDFRTWPKPWLPGQLSRQTKDVLALAIRSRLNLEFPAQFDVVVEKTHIHVEHDPRRP